MCAPDIIIAEHKGHSEKPSDYFQIAEELLNETPMKEFPKLEIFSRKLYDHHRWVAIGN